ncbi:hypothetical protein [Clostridium botulinum]|uniref:Uncharacterized protein n=1 Tax=Clostridium botulinum (strain Hall / ATCC 3502 / NCTC 13319 / Type A) TaxID=441771 RepID=A5I172_CLOBH|nr:hypothetical protein [Clostridium botulinum]EPS49725.1 hypothetical protein CFSAN002369_10760 [Clostridium botulinum CFSAN002369]EPS50578.1 hypothetical protein CFSAN002367_11464 [Clostridium botulinum CFSAN002367]ABS35101.1 hypothetical protein CLB_1263 [Clostridium botulinum A str. ATCC 19397]ABS37043.1 hypothetical protein CLC_1275 [Clostridium botulinum A str. Hall]AWB17147.1 hypothetical protein DB732_06635 [Clostridium botulinum]
MENNNLEIYISKEASENLSKLLKENDYSCVRLSYVKSCCARGRLDIVLDNIKEKDLKHEYASIILVYNTEVSNNIKKVEIIYKNNDFMMKITPRDTNGCRNGCCKNNTSSNCNNNCNNSCNNKCPYKNKTCSKS